MFSLLFLSVFKKLLLLILSLFALSLMVFYMARLSPGDPLRAYYGESAERMNSQEASRAIETLGLNKPIYTQYKEWILSAVQGDFGISFLYKQPVTTVIKERYIHTLLLGGISYILTFLLALLLSVLCVKYAEGYLDRFLCKVGLIAHSIPTFWTAILFIMIFSVNLKLLPSSGAYNIGEKSSVTGRILHLILPVTVLVISHLWYDTYLLRNKLMEESFKDYVVLAKLKGLSSNRILWIHCVPNILPAFFHLMAISMAHMLAGTYLVEQVFSYPGLGALCFESAKYHDYNMLMVITLITGTIVMLSNVIAQLLADSIHPQLKMMDRRSGVYEYKKS